MSQNPISIRPSQSPEALSIGMKHESGAWIWVEPYSHEGEVVLSKAAPNTATIEYMHTRKVSKSVSDYCDNADYTTLELFGGQPVDGY
jgi:hypothetical protein